MKSHLKDRGAALFLAVIYSLISAAVGMSIIYMHSMSMIMTNRDISEAKTLYVAEAGIDYCKQWIRNNQPSPSPSFLSEGSPADTVILTVSSQQITLASDSNLLFSAHVAKISPPLGPTAVECFYLVSSTGTDGYTRKNVMAQVKISKAMPANTMTFRTMDFMEMPTERL